MSYDKTFEQYCVSIIWLSQLGIYFRASQMASIYKIGMYTMY